MVRYAYQYYLVCLKMYIFYCTICTSDNELMLSTYMVTPTSTGKPETRKNKKKKKSKSKLKMIRNDGNSLKQR